MWEKLYNALSTLVTLGVKVEKHEKEIDILKAENRELAAVLHEVLAESEMSHNRETQTVGKFLSLLKINC